MYYPTGDLISNLDKTACYIVTMTPLEECLHVCARNDGYTAGPISMIENTFTGTVSCPPCTHR